MTYVFGTALLLAIGATRADSSAVSSTHLLRRKALRPVSPFIAAEGQAPTVRFVCTPLPSFSLAGPYADVAAGPCAGRPALSLGGDATTVVSPFSQAAPAPTTFYCPAISNGNFSAYGTR